MNHKIAYEEINYENSDYELDVWSSCFNPIFNPPPEVIEEWNHRFDDEWKEPEPTLENTSVYFTEDGANYLIVGKTIIPISEHFADNGKTVGDVIEDVIRFAVKTQKNNVKFVGDKIENSPHIVQYRHEVL